MADERVSEVIYLRQRLAELEAKLDEARERERHDQITVGLLRETVGALWTTVDCIDSDLEANETLVRDTTQLALTDCERRMRVVNERFGLGADATPDRGAED